MAQIKPNILIILILSILLIFGVYLSFIGGYGSDEDTLPMIYVFEKRLADGTFVTSRFTGNPVAEMGIGFLSYFFGSFIANLVTFSLFLFGSIFIFFALSKKKDQNLYIFLLLCLSSQVLYFDNLEPIDYSWALFPFGLGFYLLSKKHLELAILLLAISVGARINFLIFIIPMVFLFNYDYKISFNKKIIIFLSIFFISGLFYIPIWYDYSFSLQWLTSARPTEQGFIGLLSRFVYKTVLALGLVQIIIIIFTFLKSKILIINFYKNRIFFSIIFLNFLLFLYIPAELSYLQPAIIFLYLFIVKFFNKKIVYTIIFLNFFSWMVNYDFLQIEYKSNDICSPKQAQNAKIKFSLEPGGIERYLKSREMIKCWAYDTHKERSDKIIQGKALK
jgi:hypothetical protein